jgi:GNAT superfamily N-acetyltransferase
MCIFIKSVNNTNIHQNININIFSNIIYNNFIELKNINYLIHNKKDIINLLLNKNFNGFLLFDNSKIIGYLIGKFTILSDGRYVYFLDYIYIAKNFRNKKLGELLINKLISYCLENGVNIITLICDYSDEKVIKFYNKFGFIKDTFLNNHKKHNILSLYINE